MRAELGINRYGMYVLQIILLEFGETLVLKQRAEQKEIEISVEGNLERKKWK